MGSLTLTSSLTPYQPTWAVRAGPACPTQYRPTVPLPAPSRAACGGQMGVLSRLTGDAGEPGVWHVWPQARPTHPRPGLAEARGPFPNSRGNKAFK